MRRGLAAMPTNEREALIDQLNRCRDLLHLTNDSVHRRTIIDLVAYLEAKLAEMDAGLET
jgi:hypothetical protein